MRLLVVDDDELMVNLLSPGFEARGYQVDVACNGDEALELGRKSYDLIIMDLLLPGKNGTEVCQTLRQEHIQTPILMLSAKDDTHYKIAGLEYGADDYLTKPFDFQELMARVQALIRRSDYKDQMGTVLTVGNLTLNRDTREVNRGGHQLGLTPKEFAILEFLMSNPNRPLSFQRIHEEIWGSQPDTMSQIVAVYIRYLRHKVDRGYKKKLIKTVRGIGYKISFP